MSVMRGTWIVGLLVGLAGWLADAGDRPSDFAVGVRWVGLSVFVFGAAGDAFQVIREKAYLDNASPTEAHQYLERRELAKLRNQVRGTNQLLGCGCLLVILLFFGVPIVGMILTGIFGAGAILAF